MKDYFPILSKSMLFQGITEAELEGITTWLCPTVKVYEKGRFILRAGDLTEVLGIVLEGKVLIIKENVWGERNIVTSMGEGQCFAETFASTFGKELDVSVESATRCKIMFLNVRKILTANPENYPYHNQMIRNLLNEIANKNLYLSQKLNHLGQRTTRMKLLSFLSGEAQRQGTSEFEIHYTRQQLADYLCVDRSGLCVELGKMKEEGILEYNKNHFKLDLAQTCPY